MEKKYIAWKTKGMNRDSSVSAFSPEFSFENRNMRLSTNEGNTLLSWVNEKGTTRKDLTFEEKEEESGTFEGTPIGTAVINHQLVLFTTKSEPEETFPDYIYVIEHKNNGYYRKILYHGKLNFDVKYPLETLVSYESSDVQKVYWTDGKNQPRVINIKASEDQLKLWKEAERNNIDHIDTYFDFVPSSELRSVLNVSRNSEGGYFEAGVIQYCYTYYNKNGQQSNVIDVSPLYYLSHADRGCSPEDTVNCSFDITILDPDAHFDYVRLYSIQRTSLNLDAKVRIVTDIPINKNFIPTVGEEIAIIADDIYYTDNGTSGSTMDPLELLFVGGKEITALTMTDKDNTLFLGNISQKNSNVSPIQDYLDSIRGGNNAIGIDYCNDNDKTLLLEDTSGFYSHTHTLKKNSREITTLKGGETYRFGFQLQKVTGEWSEPLFIDDKKNDKYPNSKLYEPEVNLVYAQAEIDLSSFDSGVEDFYTTYRKIRPVIVYPNAGERSVVCQGVLNPTVFNVEDRPSNSPYAQASWYFRPYVITKEAEEEPEDEGTASDDVVVSKKTYTSGSFIPQNVKVDKAFENIVHPSYVLICRGERTTIDWAVATKTLYFQFDVDGTSIDTHVDFLGVIYLTEYENDICTVAFVSRTDYVAEIKKVLGAGIEEFLAEGLENNVYVRSVNTGDPAHYPFIYAQLELDGGTRGMIFPLYEDMQVEDSSYSQNPTQKLYYVAPNNGGEYQNYVFRFYNREYYRNDNKIGPAEYAVLFSNRTRGSRTSRKVVTQTKGGFISFTHYDSLATEYDLLDFNGEEEPQELKADAEPRNVEIQGSRNMYANPYSAKVEDVKDSNTQFFIDQSIVTLNSPDIDFDTQVQRINPDTLKLRIVGAIPLTASVSSHHFSATLKEYLGQVTTTHEKDKYDYGLGEVDVNVRYNNYSLLGGSKLVADYLWNDAVITGYGDVSVTTLDRAHDYLVYPWQRNGSLNNDTRSKDTASSWLNTKREANLTYSHNTEYLSTPLEYGNISTQMFLTENSEVGNIRLPKKGADMFDINYYANIDKVLYNSDEYYVIFKEGLLKVGGREASLPPSGPFKIMGPVSMKYKSTSHAVVSLNEVVSWNEDEGKEEKYIPILPYLEESESPEVEVGKYDFEGYTQDTPTYWKEKLSFSQNKINTSGMFMYNNEHRPHNVLLLGELYRDIANPFGGKSKEALRENTWYVGGDAVEIPVPAQEDTDNKILLKWTEGDTYYQRYDCLKTYPFTYEDQNQLVEILSFMCETHVNIDGRYDRNRGQLDNTLMSPQNFNLLNDVYTQRDNFFNYKKTGITSSDDLVYPNQLIFTLSKTSGADIDEYTHITMGSPLELAGDKGEIRSLRKYNDQILAFQDDSISQILYNENVQISSMQGVPIEIANSGKVQGYRYISDTTGCSNKWSIVTTPGGIYYIDSKNKNLYLYNGQLSNLSGSLGMNSWLKQSLQGKTEPWNPVDFGNFVSYYDKQNQDVLFINSEECLAYSERLGAFTSFYDYGNAPYFCNFDDRGVWFNRAADSEENKYYLWEHRAGDYCTFFDKIYPYSMTLIGNQEPLRDKIFTNLEFRATVDGEGTENSNLPLYTTFLPFDSVEVWNEYQHGIAQLQDRHGNPAMRHHDEDNIASLKRKFRIWRCDVPRDNAPITSDESLGIKRFKTHPLDRMRNPWVYLKLQKEAKNQMPRAEVHDMMMAYYC